MTCKMLQERMDDYFDGELPQVQREAIEAHLSACEDCQTLYATEQAFRDQLKAMPVPSPSAGFADRVLAKAVESNVSRHHRHGFVTGFGSALVAGLALWVVVGLFPVQQGDMPDGKEPLQTVSIALNQTRDVKLVFNASHDIRGAKIAIELPDNVMLAGYPGRKRLEWQTDLAKGSNLLRLPVVASQLEAGQLVAHIEHGDRVTTLKIRIDVQAPRRIDEVRLPDPRMA